MENQLKDSAVIADVLKDVRGQFFWWGGYAQFQKMPCDLEFNPLLKDKNLIKIWVSPYSVQVEGNTYPFRQILKDEGFYWNKSSGWVWETDLKSVDDFLAVIETALYIKTKLVNAGAKVIGLEDLERSKKE